VDPNEEDVLMNTTDKTPVEFLEYVKDHGTLTAVKTWTLNWADETVGEGVATVWEVDPGVYNMTAKHDYAYLPKLRMDKGVFRRQVTDCDVDEWWEVDRGSMTAKSLFNYFNQMKASFEEDSGSC